MSRYIDTDNIRITATTMADEMGEIFVSLTDVRKCIDQTPTADVVEVAKAKADTVQKMLDRITEHASNGYPRKVRLDVIEEIAKEILEENNG